MNRRSSADMTETSFGSHAKETKNFRLRNGRNQGTFGRRSQTLPGVSKAAQIKLAIPAECKVLCFCQQKHMQMPPVQNPQKSDMTMQGGETHKSPFNISGFAPSATNMSKLSDGQMPGNHLSDTLITMCEHAATGNVKVISDILLQQVENLSKTDKNYQQNLEIAGGSLEKIRFVRGANYLHQMSDIVMKQEKEISG